MSEEFIRVPIIPTDEMLEAAVNMPVGVYEDGGEEYNMYLDEEKAREIWEAMLKVYKLGIE